MKKIWKCTESQMKVAAVGNWTQTSIFWDPCGLTSIAWSLDSDAAISISRSHDISGYLWIYICLYSTKSQSRHCHVIVYSICSNSALNLKNNMGFPAGPFDCTDSAVRFLYCLSSDPAWSHWFAHRYKKKSADWCISTVIQTLEPRTSFYSWTFDLPSDHLTLRAENIFLHGFWSAARSFEIVWDSLKQVSKKFISEGAFFMWMPCNVMSCA